VRRFVDLNMLGGIRLPDSAFPDIEGKEQRAVS
jgi:hypothetical protein